MEEKGILLDLGKPYTNTLKKALEQHQNINDNLDKAVQDIDFENIQEHTVLLDSFKIVKIIYNYKYMFL